MITEEHVTTVIKSRLLIGYFATFSLKTKFMLSSHGLTVELQFTYFGSNDERWAQISSMWLYDAEFAKQILPRIYGNGNTETIKNLSVWVSSARDFCIGSLLSWTQIVNYTTCNEGGFMLLYHGHQQLLASQSGKVQPTTSLTLSLATEHVVPSDGFSQYVTVMVLCFAPASFS